MFNAIDSTGALKAVFQLSEDGETLKLFSAAGELVRVVSLKGGGPAEIKPAEASFAFPASDFIASAPDTSFWFFVFDVFGAIAKGISEPKSGFATYQTSGYVFPNQVSTVDLKTAIKSLKTVGPATNIDDETIGNRSIYFASYSSGDADSGVTINNGDLTSNYSTVPVIRGNNPVSAQFFYNSNSANPRAYISTAVKLQNREIKENSYLIVCGVVQRKGYEFDNDICPSVASWILQICSSPELPDSADRAFDKRTIPDPNARPEERKISFRAGYVRSEKWCDEFPELVSNTTRGDPAEVSLKLQLPVRDPAHATNTVVIHYKYDPAIKTSRHVYLWDGKTFGSAASVPTGSYAYNTTFTETYYYAPQGGGATKTLNVDFKIPKEKLDLPPRVVIRNEQNSPFGAGWTLGGLQYIYDNDPADGLITLADGDGSIKNFKGSNLYESVYFGPEGNFSFIKRNSGAETTVSQDCGNESWYYWRKLKDGTNTITKMIRPSLAGLA